MDNASVFILFIVYIWPGQLPPLALAGESFSISHFGSENIFFLISIIIIIPIFRSTFLMRNNALTAGFWRKGNVEVVVNDRHDG